MEPISIIAGIVSLLSALSGATAKGVKAGKERKARREGEEYEKRVGKIKDRETKKQDRLQRMKALQGAVDSDYTYVPRTAPKLPDAPESPDFMAEDMVEGISSGVGALANSGLVQKAGSGVAQNKMMDAGTAGAKSVGDPSYLNTNYTGTNQPYASRYKRYLSNMG